MRIGSKNIDETFSIKFLGVILDEHISWSDHIKTVQSKLQPTSAISNFQRNSEKVRGSECSRSRKIKKKKKKICILHTRKYINLTIGKTPSIGVSWLLLDKSHLQTTSSTRL